ncbi:unnamed protein product [Hapterophycus canaliculatus]
MTPARSMLGMLAVLLLSARLEAFSVHPTVTKSCRRGAVGPSSAGVDARAGRSAALAVAAGLPPLKSAASSRANGVALRMGVDAVSEVAATDLFDREFQLEELEDRDVAETSVVLNTDGSISAGATNGPIPIGVRGRWSFDGTAFRMDIHREFDAAIPYVVSRVMTGYVEETLPATDTVIITGDIVMDGMDVGFFKMISSPADIVDSLHHLDQQLLKRKEQP